MYEQKRAKLKTGGRIVGTPRVFLELPEEEAAFVEIKPALGRTLQPLLRRRNYGHGPAWSTPTPAAWAEQALP